MPQSLKLPDGYKVLDSGKDRSKGLYRMIKRPNGTVYKEWYHLYSPAELQALKDKDNKEFGQISSHNLEGNAKSATGLAAATGAVAAGAYYNMSADRQSKLKRLVRGATLGKTRPQGVGVKTPTGSAGDVRGRVVPDRPPAIVRSVDSPTKRGSTMPQTGNLFDQPEPPSGKSKPGQRYAPAGTAKATGKGRRGVPRPAPRVSSKSSGPAPKPPVTQARPTPLNPNRPTPLNSRYTPTQARPTPLNPNAYPTPLDPNADPRLGRESVLRPDGTRTRYVATGDSVTERMTGAQTRAANGERPLSRIPGARPSSGTNTPGSPAPAPQASSGGTPKPKTRYAPAGTAKVTGKGGRGVPRPAPRSNFKPATGAKSTGGSPQAPSRPTPINPNRPTPLNPNYTPTQARPTPLNPEPLVPNSPYKPAPVKPSFLGRVKGFVKASVPAAIATHMLEDAGAGVMSAARGDWKGAGQRGLDLLSHTKFGGLIPVADQAMKGITGKGFRDNATSLGDKIIHAKYIDGKQPASAPRAATPAQSGGGQPGGTSQRPSGPAYFPEAGRNGSAVRTPDSYLGEAFDYSLQKGTTSGTKYLEHMFRRDKISADDQQRLRERFNKKVVGDQTLQEYGADKGITQTLEGKKSGLGEALLGKYRDTGTYKGNTDYGTMRAAAEARMARK